MSVTYTRWDEQELREVDELISSTYPSYYSAQFLLFLSGERPSVGLPMCVDGAEEVIGELNRRFPYPTFDAPVIDDTIFCRRPREQEAAQKLVDEAAQMSEDDVHWTAGRAFGYPETAIDFFIGRFEEPYPSIADARITLNDLLRTGEISPREQRCAKLIPYVYPGDRATVRQCVETATEWAAALPDGVTY